MGVMLHNMSIISKTACMSREVPAGVASAVCDGKSESDMEGRCSVVNDGLGIMGLVGGVLYVFLQEDFQAAEALLRDA